MAGLVEQLGGLGVGVGVQELVEQGEGLGVGLAGLPGRWRDRDRQAGALPAAEADVQVDLVGLGEGDVVDEQPGDAFAFPLGGGRVRPQRGEVGGEGADAGPVLVGEGGLGGGVGPLVVVLGGLEGSQGVVPVGFQGVVKDRGISLLSIIEIPHVARHPDGGLTTAWSLASPPRR